MRLRNIALLLIFAVGFAFSSFSATFTIDFNPDAPANTNGWDLSKSNSQTNTTATPAGRKLSPSTKGKTLSIESPVYKDRITDVSLLYKGINVGTDNTSVLTIAGRTSKATDYQDIYVLTGVSGAKTTLSADEIATALKTFECHQIKISYTKETGNLVVSTVTITDDRTTGDGTTGEITENATGDGGSGEEGGESGGDGSGDGDSKGGETKITAPTGVRAGLLLDGKIRLGWTTPDAATNVMLRVWTLTKTGGLAAITDNDVLWRETFADLPAAKANDNTQISENDIAKYTDKGLDGWDIERFAYVYPSTNASAVKVGTGDFAGALVTKPLNISGDGLALVVTAKHNKTNPNVILHAAALSSNATMTNNLGQTTLSGEFDKYAFPIGSALTTTDAFLIESVRGTSNDRRIIIDDIALVKNYTPITVTTNEVVCVNLGDEIDEYELEAADVVRYAALCAQDANGETSEWTTTLTLDPATLEEWKDHHLTLNSHGKAEARLDIETLPDETDDKYDVANEPFRFLIGGLEQTFISKRKDVRVSFSKGIYVCTNVFGNSWITIIPKSAETKTDVQEAEVRVAIESGEFSVRQISLAGTFAQLNVSNNVERSLLFQRRWITKEGTETAWTTFDTFKTHYTSSDAAPDLASTVSNVNVTTKFRAPAGARIEVRIVNKKGEGQKEAPIGFRDLVLQAESAPRAIIIFLR